MAYKLKWKAEVKDEFAGLDHSIQKLAFAQFAKLSKSPQLGTPLGNKAGLDLTGFTKIYFFKKKYRIVYQIDERNETVIIFSVGKREDMEVYHRAIRLLKSM